MLDFQTWIARELETKQKANKKFTIIFRDAEEELDKLTKLADRINSQINSSDPPPISNGPQTVDLDQLFNFLSQVRGR